MGLKWERMAKEVTEAGTTIVYNAVGCPLEIQSRKRHIPHANGCGTWDHTTYYVMFNGYDLKEFYSLKDAKEYAEKQNGGVWDTYARA